MKPRISVVITDLDNTLYDWVDIWYRSFKPMLDRLVEMSGIRTDVLISEFKAIHEKHGTSEYAFSIEELPSLCEQHPSEDLARIYEDAIIAFRTGRKKATKLYPTVQRTLDTLREKGVLIAAYTESMAYYSCSRIKRLGLDEIIDFLYSPPDHVLPNGLTPEQVRTLPPDHYELARTVKKETPQGKLKPSPEVLGDILNDLKADRHEVVYVGDDLVKDVSMAKQAGVLDIWAKYGRAHDREEYDLLKRVTHWTDAAVRKQKEATQSHIQPTIVLENCFEDILQYLTPVPFDCHASRKD